MRTSTLSAAFLLVGAGAGALAAIEPGGGNNIALNGSDTLFEVTKAVIQTCGTKFGDFNSDGISYLGGGSGVGAGQMGLGLQEISPMSRALKNTEYCTPGTTAAGQGAAATNTEALLVGIDGVAITANKTNSCQTDATANPSGAAVPFGSQTSFAVAGTPCQGCDASGHYTLGDSGAALFAGAPSFDALSVIYFGLTHDGFYDCNGNVRKSLAANWSALFNISCPAAGSGSGTGNCPTGLQHAWRRSDLSGTTDAFVSVLNPPNGTATNGKGAGVSVGIGTLSNVPVGAAQKSNPFCNSSDANSGIPATVSFGGSSDFQDLDPIRTVCSTTDNVCEAFSGGGTASKFKGDLGLVLPILVPDSTTVTFGEFYPAQPAAAPVCGGGCALIPIAKSALVGTTLCPNGLQPYAGSCYMPVIAGSSPPDPRCVASNSQTCIDTQGKRDGRTYNLIQMAVSANLPTNKRAGATYQWAFDANNRFMSGSFFRVRSGVQADPSNTGTGICQEGDDTLQIGCLADSNNCTIGFAGRASSSDFTDTPNSTGTVDLVKAMALNGANGFGYVPPYAPLADHDAYLEALVNGSGTTLYPLARRLYLSTLYGYNNLGGGELELAKCYATASVVDPAITGNGFVVIPGNGGSIPAGPECIDYPETKASTSSPAPNLPGTGPVVFPGCNSGGTAVDACTTAAKPVDINGAGIPESL